MNDTEKRYSADDTVGLVIGFAFVVLVLSFLGDVMEDPTGSVVFRVLFVAGLIIWGITSLFEYGGVFLVARCLLRAAIVIAGIWILVVYGGDRFQSAITWAIVFWPISLISALVFILSDE